MQNAWTQHISIESCEVNAIEMNKQVRSCQIGITTLFGCFPLDDVGCYDKCTI